MPSDHRSHPHRHGHRGGHSSLWLAHGVHRQPVHRVGRRQFLTELGRNTFAIAVLGGVAAACSGDDATADDPAERELLPATSATSQPAGASADPVTTDPAATNPAATNPVATDPATTQTPTSGDLRWAQANLGFVSAYVLVRGNEAAIVDTGSAGSVDQIGEALATLSATFDDVRHVVLTHSHPDHIGSLNDVLERASSSAAYAGAADIPNISAPAEIIDVGDGDDVFGLQVFDTPGHTPGSISVFDPGIGLLVVGDALSGNDDGSGLSGPNEQFTPDMSTANESVAKLAALDADAVAMGHGQPVPSGAGALLSAFAAEL